MKKDWHKAIKKLVNNKQLFSEMTAKEFIERVKENNELSKGNGEVKIEIKYKEIKE